MNEFAGAALPWILLGLSLACFFSSYSANDKKKRETNGQHENYSLLGMLLGIAVGFAVGSVSGQGQMGMTIGMMLGYSLGSLFTKNKK